MESKFCRILVLLLLVSMFAVCSNFQPSKVWPSVEAKGGSAPPSPIHVSLSATPRSGIAPLTVTFSASAEGAFPDFDYSWSFGDGTSTYDSGEFGNNSVVVVVHKFQGGGIGTDIVALTVTDSDGYQAEKMLTITCNPPSWIDFVEKGLPSNAMWWVTLNKTTYYSMSNPTTISCGVIPSSYPFSISNVYGYTSSPSSGSVTVNTGSNVTQNITFKALPTYNVIFDESGLPSGTTWGVWLQSGGGGGLKTSTASAGSDIKFTAYNESGYTYDINPVPNGFNATPSSGTIYSPLGAAGSNSEPPIIQFKPIPAMPPTIHSKYSGYFLENVHLTNVFEIITYNTSAGAYPSSVSATLDTTKWTWQGNSKNIYYLSTDMYSVTSGSSLVVNASYANGYIANASYPLEVIDPSSGNGWLLSVIQKSSSPNIQNLTSNAWDNCYNLTLNVKFGLDSVLKVPISLGSTALGFQAGGTYCFAPSVDFQFVFRSSDAKMWMSSSLTGLSLPTIEVGPVNVTVSKVTIAASGTFTANANTITWSSGSLNVTTAISGSYTADTPAGFSFTVLGNKVTIGLTLTVIVGTTFAVNTILASTSGSGIGGLGIIISSILTSAIIFSVSLKASFGGNVDGFGASISAQGTLSFNLALNGNPPAGGPYFGQKTVTAGFQGNVNVNLRFFSLNWQIFNLNNIQLLTLSDPPVNYTLPSNYTLMPRYYDTPNYDSIVWMPGAQSGTAVNDIYPFTKVSICSLGNDTYILYTTDNTSLPNSIDAMSLGGLQFHSGEITRLRMPFVANEIMVNPTAVALPNGTLLAMWYSAPYSEMDNISNPFEISEMLIQYSCYDPLSGEWGPVGNLTSSGVALSKSISTTSTGSYALVLEGDRLWSSGNQTLEEYSLQNGAELLNAPIGNVSGIVSFNEASQLAVLQCLDGSYELFNLREDELMLLPSMDGYSIVNVQLAANSPDSLGILYSNSASSVFCIYNVSSHTSSFGMALSQTPTSFTFIQEGSEYRLITINASGITAYSIAGHNAGPPLVCPMQNVTAMGSTITGGTILVYTTENYGNYTNPLLNLTLTSFPDLSARVNVAVTNIVPSKTIVGQGLSDRINVTVANHGSYAETFNAIAYATATLVTQGAPDEFIIASQNLTLISGNSGTITLSWDTKGLAYGNYTISAYASSVQGQTNIDNMYVSGIVMVTIPGDVGGYHVVNILDVVMITSRYGLKQGNPNFNPNCDILDVGQINILDVVACTSHYGQKW